MCLSSLSNRQFTTSNPATDALHYYTRQAPENQNDGANVIRVTGLATVLIIAFCARQKHLLLIGK